MREIAKQLYQEGSVDLDDSSLASSAAILSALLRILEPKDATDEEGAAGMKPLIIVLDEFELFALRDMRQSFLYCLLDIVQSKRRSGGMAVVGCSARLDCLGQLEKRVKSRCQSRVHHIHPPETERQMMQIASACLQVDEDLVSPVVRELSLDEVRAAVATWNAQIRVSRIGNGPCNQAIEFDFADSVGESGCPRTNIPDFSDDCCQRRYARASGV